MRGGAGLQGAVPHQTLHFTAPNTDKNWMDSVISHSPEGRGVGAVM